MVKIDLKLSHVTKRGAMGCRNVEMQNDYMSKLFPWQERAKRIIEPLLAREDFRSTLSRYRKPDASWLYEVDTNYLDDSSICSLYNLPSNMTALVSHLAETGNVDYDLIPAPVSLKRGPENRAIAYIEITHNALRDDVETFIEREWTTIAKTANRPKAWLSRPTGQVKETFFAQRDAEIFEMYANGTKPKQLAEKTGLDDATIRQIVYRQKKKQQPRSIKQVVSKKEGENVTIAERYITSGNGKEGEQNPQI